MINDWAKGLDIGSQTDCFDLDFGKALDAVLRELLEAKLHRYRVSSQVLN